MPSVHAIHQPAVRHLRRVDPRLAEVIRRVGPCTMTYGRCRYRALVRAIVGQQVSTKAAAAVFARLGQQAGGVVTAERIARLAHDDLRAAGLSRGKCRYVHDLTERVNDGRLRLDRLGRICDDEVIDELTEVLGVGEWTAHMFLMFVLARPDVLPTGDLGVRTAFQRIYGLRALPERERMQSLAQPWRPYRSVAAWFLWRSLDADSV